jgi:hypothetical protein
MTPWGRDRCRGFRGTRGDPSAAMGSARPHNPIWTIGTRLSSATFGRKKTSQHASRISGGAGRARRRLRHPDGAFTPG